MFRHKTAENLLVLLIIFKGGNSCIRGREKSYFGILRKQKIFFPLLQIMCSATFHKVQKTELKV